MEHSDELVYVEAYLTSGVAARGSCAPGRGNSVKVSRPEDAGVSKEANVFDG